MIIVRLSGGIGNQMFQFAAGLSAANWNNTELFLDIEYFRKNQIHNGFELNRAFKNQCKISSPSRTRSILGIRANKWILKTILRFEGKLLRGQHLYSQPSFNYDNNFDKISEDSYLIGYFQSEKYFYKIKDLIRKHFIFKNKLSKSNTDLLKLIKNSNSVSIHIRRGDYVTNKKAFDIHGICSSKYYKNAISYIKKNVRNPYFYIFSDDEELVRNNFIREKNLKIVDINKNNQSYIDMLLMSNCKHNIIANSSFSWWAAWLNNNPSKIVIAPKKWFKSGSFSTTDLIPEGWIKING